MNIKSELKIGLEWFEAEQPCVGKKRANEIMSC